MFSLPVNSFSQFELGKVKRNLSWDDMNAKEILAHQVPEKGNVNRLFSKYSLDLFLN